APLTGEVALSVRAVDGPGGDAGEVISQVPVGGPAELVHFSILPDGTRATLTANPADGSPDKVLFFDLTAPGAIVHTAEAATCGERARSAALGRAGCTRLNPTNASRSVSTIGAPSMAPRRVVETASEYGPLAQPYAPGPTHAGAFFASNS